VGFDGFAGGELLLPDECGEPAGGNGCDVFHGDDAITDGELKVLRRGGTGAYTAA
jgi:hypothetical protein